MPAEYPASLNPRDMGSWGVFDLHFRTLLSVCTAAALFSWVALINRAPLVFPDTLAYTLSVKDGELPSFFSVFYALYIFPLNAGGTFWPVVLAQGACTAYALYLTMKVVLQEQRVSAFCYFATIGLLALGSGLPWITGQLLPDSLTALLALSLYLLLFNAKSLGGLERLFCLLLLFVSVTAHLSHLPIAVCLLLAGTTLRAVIGRRLGLFRDAAVVLATITAAAGCMLAVTWTGTGTVGLARNSNVFLLAKLLDEGPALKVLKNRCPVAGWRLCEQISKLEGLTHDDLKWGEESPLRALGPFDSLEPEAKDIVAATLRSYPGEIIGRSISDGIKQLARFALGEGLTPRFAKFVAKHLKVAFGEYSGALFEQSRQAEGTLPVETMRLVSNIALAAALLTLLLLSPLLAWRSALGTFVAYCVLAVIITAFITGGLSGPYDRYLARVVWLLCFAAILSAICSKDVLLLSLRARLRPR